MADTGSAECRPSASSADQTVDLRDCTIPCFDQYHLNAANGVEPSSVMAFVGSVPQQDHVSAAATTAATSDNWMFQQTQQHVQIPYWAMNQTPIPIEQFGKEAFNHMMILPSGSLPDGQQLAQKGPGGKITPSASTPTMTVHHRHSLPELPLSSSSSSTSSSSLRCRRRTVGSIPPSQDQDEEQKRKNFLERNRQAALKCRQRKKQWLENLQNQVEYLNADNEKLERQVTILQEEILNLKTLLLAHQNCPVAQANGVVYDAVMKPN